MNEIIELKKKIDEVKNTRGKQKQTVIAKHKDDKLFINTLEFVFNPHFSTGIAKKKMNKNLIPEGSVETFRGFDRLEDVYDYIRKFNTGSDVTVRTLQAFIITQDEEVHELLRNIFTQDLQIGASKRTINKSLGYDLIPIWDVMLAKRWEKEEHKVNGKFFITQKMDDYRCTIIYDDKLDKWVLRARSGLPFEDVVEIEEVLNHLPKHLVIDGGLISDNSLLDSKARFRETGKILRTDGEKRNLLFYIYDMLPKDEFLKGKSTMTYEERRHEVDKLFGYYGPKIKKLFRKVPLLYEGYDKEVIMPLLEEALEREMEGLMVNTADGLYETKRSDQLLKVKEFYTVDLRVIDYFEYKHPNMLGGFICEWKDGNTVRIGGGFKQDERVNFWKDRDSFIGKIIEVTYFQESENQDGGKSIRHGYFEQVRDDKTEPSFN